MVMQVLSEHSPSFETRPLSAVLGAEVVGLDLSDPASDLCAEAIIDLFNRSAVIAFRGQSLSPQRLVAFSKLFGTLERHTDPEYLLPGHDDIMLVGNVSVEGGVRAFFHSAKEEWHTDLIQTRTPNTATVFYALESPSEGGETRFADVRGAFEALPEEERERLSALKGVYDIRMFDAEMRKQDPDRAPLSEEKIRRNTPVRHPLVRTHPATGAKSLYFAADILSHFEGMDRDSSKALAYRLLEHATQPRFVYEHKWRDGDVVVWDNRCTLHTATPFDAEKYRRLLHRTVIAGEVPY